jgi:hypothetical protein
MTQAGRSFLDRSLRSVKPTPLRDFTPPPAQLADGLWTVERRIRLPPALIVSTTTTLVYGPVRRVAEVVLFHRPSATLILTDLAFNLTTFTSRAQAIAWRLMGVPREFGPSRSVRLTLLRDRRAAAPPLRRILDWDFRRIIVAHGAVLEHDAKAVFRRGFAAYLAGARKRGQATFSSDELSVCIEHGEKVACPLFLKADSC